VAEAISRHTLLPTNIFDLANDERKLRMAEEKPNPESASAARQLSAEASAFIQRIIDARGITISSYAQVEWYLAKLILEGKEYDQYQQIDLSFSQDAKTRADKIRAMLKVDGPLSPYADRLANKLSGGNKRKLSFAIALIGWQRSIHPAPRHN